MAGAAPCISELMAQRAPQKEPKELGQSWQSPQGALETIPCVGDTPWGWLGQGERGWDVLQEELWGG